MVLFLCVTLFGIDESRWNYHDEKAQWGEENGKEKA